MGGKERPRSRSLLEGSVFPRTRFTEMILKHVEYLGQDEIDPTVRNPGIYESFSSSILSISQHDSMNVEILTLIADHYIRFSIEKRTVLTTTVRK